MTIHSKSDDNCRVDVSTDDELVLAGYQSSCVRWFLTIVLHILTSGVSFILMSWKPAYKIRFTHRRSSLGEAQILILKDKNGNEYIEQIYTSQRDRSFAIRYFVHKKIKYIWNMDTRNFVRLHGLDNERCSVIYTQSNGATVSEASLKLDLYGRNSIEIELKPIWRLVLDEISGPFYQYQFFICSIWIIQFYYQFATCILLLSIISVATHVWQTRKQTIALKKQVHSESDVFVLRDEQKVLISSTELVPGDVLLLQRHGDPVLMECDAVLVTGSCIVDESMLTGESVPVPKVALVENSNHVYSPSIHKSNTLFAGTTLLSVQCPTNHDEIKAVVVRTGFSTAKGELARSILFPTLADDHLKIQLIKMSGIFFVLGAPCMIYTIYALKRFAFSTYDIAIIVLDVATFLIPPVLPAVLTSVNAHAQRRLKAEGIFCLNPRMITSSGEVDVMCFDKTGTLTEDSIEFDGVILSKNGRLSPIIQDVTGLDREPIVKSMATCHSLVQYQNKLEGDDLDQKVFHASGWMFVDDENISEEFGTIFGTSSQRVVACKSDAAETLAIIKQFPFESFLQRMMIIACDVQENRNVAFLKGSPEVVKSFCRPQSIPYDFEETLEEYTRRGYRVLATASKYMDYPSDELVNLSRTDIEDGMTLLGLYLFKNKVKQSTYPVLKELQDADIRCVMATGDNLLTGISVAEECRIVSPEDSIIKISAILDKSKHARITYDLIKENKQWFDLSRDVHDELDSSNVKSDNEVSHCHIAIEGESFNIIRKMKPKLFEKIVHCGTIFARMSPGQKLDLITELQRQGHRVGMCGDGANDCGALRAANSGIALSVAEASVASPFTYKNKDISCVPTLLKEGRCTLSATFGAFKYQVCYCFVLLGTALILFWYGTKPSDGSYVYVDVLLNILPPILFGTTKPASKLVKQLPIRNMISIVPQFSMYSFIIIQVSLYMFVKNWIVTEPWYEPVRVNTENIHAPNACHLSYGIFSANMLSYVVAGVIFAPGEPYRRNFFSNWKYMLVIGLNLLLATAPILWAPEFLLTFLTFQPMPFEFRAKIFALFLVNFVFCIIWETYIVNTMLRAIVYSTKRKLKCKSSKLFKEIEQQVVEENWPWNELTQNNNPCIQNEVQL